MGVTVVRLLWGCFGAIVLCAGLLSAAAFAAPAPSANRSAATGEEATPPQIQQLLTLLADPKVQTWLKQQNEAKAAAASARDTAGELVSHALDSHLAAIREHIVVLARAVPDLPDQFERAADPRHRGSR